jgi:hypothetical protein
MAGTGFITDRKDFTRIAALCVDCEKASAPLCAFIRSSDHEAGLRAVGAQAVRFEQVGPYGTEVLYRVTSCPGHKKGPLPSLARKPEFY